MSEDQKPKFTVAIFNHLETISAVNKLMMKFIGKSHETKIEVYKWFNVHRVHNSRPSMKHSNLTPSENHLSRLEEFTTRPKDDYTSQIIELKSKYPTADLVIMVVPTVETLTIGNSECAVPLMRQDILIYEKKTNSVHTTYEYDITHMFPFYVPSVTYNNYLKDLADPRKFICENDALYDRGHLKVLSQFNDVLN